MVLKYGVKMSEVTVLDIPLQGSLIPTVGTYTGEGRTDTTFSTDNTLNEQYLYSPDRNHTGYYYYYPLTIPDGVTLKIELDINIRSDWLQPWIILFNVATENWWGILKHYDNAALNINGISGLLLDVYRDTRVWHHLVCTFLKTSESITITLEDTNIANSIQTATIPVNDSNYKDFSITNVALLGNEFASSSCPDCFIKKIRMYYELPVRTLLIHIGNEVCKAYSEKPVYTKSSCSYSSLVDPVVIANAVDVNNDGTYLKYSIPIVYKNGSVEYITAEHPHVGATYRNTICTSVEFNNTLNEYVISKNTEYWDNGTPNTGMQIYSELGKDGPLSFQGSNTITIEFNMIISGYYYGSGIVYLGSFYNSTGSNSFSFAYRSDTKYITDSAGGNIMQNETVKLQTSLDLNTPYNFKITMHKDINTSTLYVYIYIDNNLVYSGNMSLAGNASNYANGYFKLGFSNRAYKAKLGGFKVTHGQEIECLNVKRNNNLYYLLASNTGLYPSRLRAKIDGITYPILLKHDEDNTSE